MGASKNYLLTVAALGALAGCSTMYTQSERIRETLAQAGLPHVVVSQIGRAHV